MKNYDALNDQEVFVSSDAEALLVIANIKSARAKMEEEIDKEEPHIQSLIKAITNTYQLRNAVKIIDNKLDELMSESEKLIESPEAGTLEVLARREELRNEINELLESKEEIRPLLMEIKEAEKIIRTSSREDRARAEAVMERVFGKAPDVHPNPTGQN